MTSEPAGSRRKQIASPRHGEFPSNEFQFCMRLIPRDGALSTGTRRAAAQRQKPRRRDHGAAEKLGRFERRVLLLWTRPERTYSTGGRQKSLRFRELFLRRATDAPRERASCSDPRRR